MRRARTAPALLALGLALAVEPAAAQPLALQRTLPAGGTLPCPAPPTSPRAPAPSAERRAEARRLGASAATSLLAGEPQEARALLQRAVALDPGSTELAYRLARAHEELGDAAEALGVYCTLWASAPDATAAADAEERIRTLVGRTGAPADTVAGHFAAGVRRWDGGDLAGADAAFTSAIRAAPAMAPAYYDRAVVRLARGQVGDALADLDRYAQLAPGALDAGTLRARDVLRRGRHEPNAVLVSGLAPGGAQFRTGRHGMGALVALATAAGVYLALDGRAVFEQRTALDPFGNPYTYTDPRPTRTHPNRGLGIGIAGVAILAGAVEGFLHAREGRAAVDALRAGLRTAVARTP